MQLVAPPDENVPGAQSMQVEASLGEYLPELHDMHDAAPASSAYLPGSQAVHVSARVVEKVPAGHSVQLTDPAPANLPASHESHVVAPEDVPVCEPATHSRQASSWAVGAYRPASHAMQRVSFTVYCPAWHSTHEVKSSDDRRPAGQSAHARALFGSAE